MMNITNKIRKDIELYNGIPATQTTTTSTNMLGSTTVSSSYTIFTYGTLKIILLIILILLILWSVYNSNISMNTTNISMNNYNNTIKYILDNIKSTWNKIIQYIKSITSFKKTTSSSSTSTSTTNSNSSTSSNSGQTAHVYIKPEIASKDAIKTALDANALKYTMTVENKDNNTNEVPGWCYIGKDPSGFGVCVQSNNSNLCESNMFYDTEEKCINQPATTSTT